MTASDLQSRFARAVEAEYDRRLAAYEADGIDPAHAHTRALEEAKELGRQALEELRRRGLFPWLPAREIARRKPGRSAGNPTETDDAKLEVSDV